MTPGAWHALGAMLLFGIADLIYKRAALAGVRAPQFLAVQAWCYAPAMMAYGVATRTLAFTPAAWWGALAGLLVYLGLFNFARSLQAGSVSVNAPIFRLSFTVTAALAIGWLGEPLTAFKVAGLAAALAAVWLLLAAPAAGDGHPRHARRSSLLQVLAAMLLIGIANLVYKIGVRDGATPATLLFGQAAVFVTLATAVPWLGAGGLKPPAAAWRHAPVTAALFFGGFLLLLEGLTRGEASVLVPIAQMGFVVTAALGFAVLRETLTLRKAAGLAAALAALACLARS